jgi:alkylation response protein AidB-like acyl-CoA dehydrogenase
VRTLKRGGRCLLEDPAVRGKLGRIYADLEVQRYAALRILSALEKGESPGAAASITKLSYSEFEKRYHELVQEILGPWAQTMHSDVDGFTGVDTSSGEPGTWATAFLWSRAGTIYSSSSRSRRTSSASASSACPKRRAPTGCGLGRWRGLRR